MGYLAEGYTVGREQGKSNSSCSGEMGDPLLQGWLPRESVREEVGISVGLERTPVSLAKVQERDATNSMSG